MLKPFLTEYGTSTSQSVRDGLLLVHPLVLQLPATLRASTLLMMRKYIELVTRPSTDVLLSLTTPAASLASRPSRASSDRTSHLRRPAAVARSPTPPVEETTMKPARKAISTLRGEGTWGTTGGREQVGGQGPGGLQTIPPWVTGAPDLACKMRPRHAARVQTAGRRDSPRPYGRDTHQHQHPHRDRRTTVGERTA